MTDKSKMKDGENWQKFWFILIKFLQMYSGDVHSV